MGREYPGHPYHGGGFHRVVHFRVGDEIGGSDYTLYYLDSSIGMSVEVESFGSVAAARHAADDLGM